MSDWVTLRDRLGLTLRPIDRWPEKMQFRFERSPFKGANGWTPVRETLDTLRRELQALQARNIVLQAAFRERDFRLDGLPRADARTEHPGIIIAFDSKHGSMRLFHAGFDRWQCNLRALALHLEHLRKASLYGVGKDGQQYRGWQALPETAGQETSETPEALIIRLAESVNGWRAVSGMMTADDWRKAITLALRAAHPDTGGSHELFLTVRAAVEQVKRSRGL